MLICVVGILLSRYPTATTPQITKDEIIKYLTPYFQAIDLNSYEICTVSLIEEIGASGFEPLRYWTADLQSACFGLLHTHPYLIGGQESNLHSL